MEQQEIENLNKWHLSKYVLFAENPKNNEEIYCVNLLIRSFCILSKKEFFSLFKINDPNTSVVFPKKFFDNKIIVNYNEYDLFKTESEKNKNLTTLNFTICPTLNCNFDCPYCFENHRKTKMSLKVQENVVIFIEKMIKFFNPKKIAVTWFGGEPLLAPEIIEHLSDKIINLTEKYNLEYRASIITNGYLLTQKIVDMLYEKKVMRYQITLDGLKENHDLTRHLIGNYPTFDKIINNLRNLKIKGNIGIRNNIHENNYNDIEKLKKIINIIKKESGNNLWYYPSVIFNNNVAMLKKQPINFVDNIKLEELEILKNIKFFSNIKTTVCGAQTLHVVSIDDQGRLYKCWEDVDKPEHSFGNIETWNPEDPFNTCDNLEILNNYLNTKGAQNDLECKECVWLPICRGGCPTKRLFFKKRCVGFKNNPENYVLAVANKYLDKINLNNNKE